jgi:TPP-dependent trihydroxycyclohexane-1,2-dione (THcHDO) dehydratase
MPNSVLITAARNSKFSPTDLPAGHRFYTDSAVDAVIRTAAIPIDLLNSQTIQYRSTDGLDLIEVTMSRKIALSEWLEIAARGLYFDRQGQPAPSLSRITKEMAVISKAAEGLRVALGLLQDCDTIPPNVYVPD